MSELLRTAAHAWHVAHGGRMVPFAGWDMPVQYSSIVTEHQAVRTAAGLFDIAHMGRLRVTGPDAERFLNYVTTNNVSLLQVGQIQYSLVTNERAGVLDDILVYRFPDFHLVVVNASNREKIVAWFTAHQDQFDVQIEDLTTEWFMFAVQGPLAVSLLQPHVNVDLASMGYYTGQPAEIMGVAGLVSRTGYTGEDGFEVILPPTTGVALWEQLLADGTGQGVIAAGLGCRDTLRLEAAMPLYGHELNEEVDPLTAGLGFAVKLDKEKFLGRDTLSQIKSRSLANKRVGLRLEGRRIAREGAEVFTASGEKLGTVTSGTFSPTLEQSIAMAYVKTEHSAIGTSVMIDIRGQQVAATVVKLPFYKRA